MTQSRSVGALSRITTITVTFSLNVLRKWKLCSSHILFSISISIPKNQFELNTVAILPLRITKERVCVTTYSVYMLCMCYPNGLFACDKPDQWNCVTV